MTESINKSSAEVTTAEKSEKYATEFKVLQRKSTENFLRCGQIVYLANQEEKEIFKQFCEKIGQTTESSTISKMKKIGEHYERLMLIADNLPHAWTTLYKIAGIDDVLLAKLIKCGKLTKYTTCEELDDALGQASSEKAKGSKKSQSRSSKGNKRASSSANQSESDEETNPDEYKIVIIISRTPNSDQLKAISAIQNQAVAMGAVVNLDARIEECMHPTANEETENA